MARYNRIFAALDGGATQEAVVRRTLSIAHDNNAEVLFGHVIDSVPYEANGIDFGALIDDGRERIVEAIEPYLTRAQGDECIPSVDVQVRAGRVAETLVEALAEPFDPDLVICGVRGLSNIKYAFVGSVSTHLIRSVKCDVLVVRPESLDDEDHR
ncbi:MAG: universal stress protein [Coriobacteriaceae bacterium]|jgi:nucleotide-binding universal stress UspA family protein|nr:universal stress protein [Coriobacteriaceae bacterium]